ncbi:MAG: ABC transporter ATP-binding protein [Deltaproteobacteria bacterium]|nr:ABC transporter ATP-binding protein [Candidatus Anaeroferrophillacea bacterium]
MSLDVRGLAYAYGRHQVLTDIAFSLPPAALTCVLGVNGSGKSTLLKTINRILRPAAGTVLVDGTDIARCGRRELARRMGYMPQQTRGIRTTVYDAVMLGRRAHIGWDLCATDHEIVRRVMRTIHLEHLALRHTDTLSGGELQKVAIARALAQEPRVLLLDEPLNHLDVVNQLEVIRLIHRATLELEIVSVMVTHDLNSALRWGDRFILLKNGAVHAYGDRSIITPAAVREVFHLEVVIDEVAGMPVVVPLDTVAPAAGA